MTEEKAGEERELLLCELGRLCPIDAQKGLEQFVQGFQKEWLVAEAKFNVEEFLKEFSPELYRWKLDRSQTEDFKGQVAGLVLSIHSGSLRQGCNADAIKRLLKTSWESMWLQPDKGKIEALCEWYKEAPSSRQIAVLSYTNPWDVEHFKPDIVSIASEQFPGGTVQLVERGDRYILTASGKDVMTFYLSFKTHLGKAEMLRLVKKEFSGYSPVDGLPGWAEKQGTASPVQADNDDATAYQRVLSRWLQEKAGQKPVSGHPEETGSSESATDSPPEFFRAPSAPPAEVFTPRKEPAENGTTPQFGAQSP